MKLEIKNLTKFYGKYQALRGVSATLTEGVYGLLGQNGAGKTTLINILIGILPANGGIIQLDGEDTAHMSGRYLDKIGYMPQYPQFYANFTVQEFLAYMCRLKAVKNEKARIDEVLAFVNLCGSRSQRIGALSGGMRQRLGIAQAILNDPKVLVLDEPTAGLDPGERIRFRNLISRLAQGRIILLATHIVSDVECIAKEILLLQKGMLMMHGSPSGLAQNIQGRVWEVIVDGTDVALLSDKYCVSNMKQKQENFILRIVNKTKPLPCAVPAVPNLEDVFLYTLSCESTPGQSPCIAGCAESYSLFQNK